ncbi:hypothetical protein Tco_0153175 [Tanacetum coccineum]
MLRPTHAKSVAEALTTVVVTLCKHSRRGPHLVPVSKEDPKKKKAKRDREVMLLVLDVAKKDITRTSARTWEVNDEEIRYEQTNKILIRQSKAESRKTLREITKHQPVLKEDAEHLAEYTAYVLKLR